VLSFKKSILGVQFYLGRELLTEQELQGKILQEAQEDCIHWRKQNLELNIF